MNFLSVRTKTELTNLERENVHVHPILPTEKWVTPTALPLEMLRALDWGIGTTFSFMWDQTIDSINYCQYPCPLNRNMRENT